MPSTFDRANANEDDCKRLLDDDASMHADTTTRGAARETGTSARSAESFDVERSSGDAKPRARFSTLRLIGLNMFFLAYGAWISSFAVVTLPYESTAFFPETDAVALGGFMVIAGASQMSGPLAGYLSDRMRHAHGRRRPLIVKSASVVGPCLVALLAARTYRDDLGDVGGTLAPVMYYVAFAITMIGLNVMYTAATGLVPDLVPDEQMGEANGVLAACSAAGACLSFMWTMLWPDVGNLYFFYIGLLVTCVPITCYCAVEESTLGTGEESESDAYGEAASVSWRELASMYTISPNKPEQRSFFWLFVCRTLYYTGISAQVFLQYLLRDTAIKDTGERLSGREPQQVVAKISFIGQIGGMLFAYPAGLLSDVVGRKPLIVLACIGIISVYISFIYVHKLSTILYLSAYYGAVNGMFLSVDYALAIDCLPSRENAARWLAIWGVASFIGTSIGPTVYSLILHFSPDADKSSDYGSSQDGYTKMLLVGSGWMIMCVAFLYKVDQNWRATLR